MLYVYNTGAILKLKLNIHIHIPHEERFHLNNIMLILKSWDAEKIKYPGQKLSSAHFDYPNHPEENCQPSVTPSMG